MKEIKAYIRSQMTDAVVEALGRLDGVSGIAVVPLTAYGHAAEGGGLDAIEMTRIEVNVSGAAAERAIEQILKHARTGSGHIGDGHIYISDISETIRVRDGARGADAL